MMYGKTLTQILIILMILVLVFTAAAIFFRPLIDKQQRKWSFSIFFGAILTAVVILFLQGGSYLFAEEAGPIARVHDFKTWLGGVRDPDLSTDGFFFINTSRNLNLLKDNGYSPARTTAVADRAMLIEIFTFLNAHQDDFDVVACDLLFAQPDSLNDNKLAEVCHQLGLSNKLVLAYNAPLTVSNKAFYNRMDASIQAEVGKAGSGPVYFSSDLINADGTPGFAYNIYLKLQHARVPKRAPLIKEEDGWAFNNYIPEFQITSENEIWPANFISGDESGDNSLDHVLHLQQNNHVYDLGSLTLWEEQFTLLEALKKEKRKPRVVFIGSFSDPQIDVHQTAYGNLHGLLIMINELIFLQKGHHLLSPFVLFCFVMLQWACYTMIFVYIFWRNVDKLKVIEGKEEKRFATHISFISSLAGFVFDELYFILLLLISLLVSVIFHRLTNFITILYIILPFSYFLKYLTNNYLKHRVTGNKNAHEHI
jgi:hypothetical protein